MNTFMTTKEIEFVILKFLKKESPGPNHFTEEFHQMFKEELTLGLYNLFYKQAKRERPTSFYKASITLMPKLNKDKTERKEPY